MASFDVVNYSLRPSKCIERQLVFEGVRALQMQMDLNQLVYVGFGSVWFTDFVVAHKILGVDDMVSIEADEIGYRRAVFNAPYATVRVMHGYSAEILPRLYSDEVLSRRPWLIWLDYDFEFREAVRDDVRSLIENAPPNSILILTFNGHEANYGRAPERPERLRELFGAIVPDELSKGACKEERLQQSLADFTLDYMKSVAADLARPGGFIPAFRIIYRDNAPMVTVGGVLPAKGAVPAASIVIGADDWGCRPGKPIIAPHLTLHEAILLQSKLPRSEPLSRQLVQSFGFDLGEDQIEAFVKYYRHYPSFAQIVS